MIGKPFSQILKNMEFSDIAVQMTDIQIALAELNVDQTTHQSSREPAEQLLNEWEYLSVEHLDQHAFAQTRKIISTLNPIPVVFVHNDFTPWNIVKTENGAGIFDWGDGNLKGLPLIDLIYGLANVAFLQKNAESVLERQKIYRQLLDPQDPMGMVFQNCIHSYTQRIGLPSASIGPLRLLTWIRHSLFEFRNHQLETSDNGNSYDSVCVPFWKMELLIQGPFQSGVKLNG